MNDDDFQLPPNVLQSLKRIEEHNNRLNATLEPIRRQNAQIQTILEPIRRQNALINAAFSPINAEIEHLNQVMSVAYVPIQEVITQYQGILNNLATSIPDFDSNTTSLISSLSPTIDELFRNNSFPLAPSDEWTEKEYSEFVNQELKNAIGSDVISDMHQSYQETPSNISSDSDQTDVIDNTVKHNDLRSDIVSNEWHQRMWIENVYGSVIQLTFAYIMEYISSEAFKNAITNLINFLKGF